MKKIFWFDVETTGLDPYKNALIEIAFIIEQDKKILEEGNFLVAPSSKDHIDSRALEVNGRTLVEIGKFPSAYVIHKQLLERLSNHIDKFNKFDKLIQGAYNAAFDDSFLRSFFHKQDDKYYGSWFYSCRIDVMTLVAEFVAKGSVTLKDFKLATLCAHFGIELKAHEAISDVRATRELYYKLKEELR